MENKLLLYSTALEVYKADELFNQLADNGDPFPLLNAMEPDEVSVHLPHCLAIALTENLLILFT